MRGAFLNPIRRPNVNKVVRHYFRYLPIRLTESAIHLIRTSGSKHTYSAFSESFVTVPNGTPPELCATLSFLDLAHLH